jgi:hypothetical protein
MGFVDYSEGNAKRPPQRAATGLWVERRHVEDHHTLLACLAFKAHKSLTIRSRPKRAAVPLAERPAERA